MNKPKWISLILTMFLFSVSEASEPLDLNDFCMGQEKTHDQSPAMKLVPLPDGDLLFLDQGFCSALRESRKDEHGGSGWKVRFYASHSFTRYFNSDMTFQSSRYNVEIKDYEWAERGSREFFTPREWAKPASNPLQMLDEPTNTFTVSLEKDGHEFYLSAFHPKFFQEPGQVKHMAGTIDGVAVDQVQAVSEPFHGYTFRPGESKLVRNEFTYGQMIFEAGYGHRFTLIRSKIGSITYIPQVGVGLMTGRNLSVMVKAGEWWEFDESKTALGVNGFGASAGNRIEINSRNEKFGVFYENRVGYYKMQSKFFDGTQKFNLGFIGNSVGVKFMLYHKKRAPAHLME
ncbi:MAG: hypothetical protein KGP28_13060 [Bdellovibrionales bacterium]|nr:hypothetical protein [Bdellovibrionales bacterium]